MKNKFKYSIAFIIFCHIIFSGNNTFAAIGDGTEHPNEVGGFGQSTQSTDQGSSASSIPASPNPQGGFGGDQVLDDADPPTDEVPVPLDGGASLLIAAGICLGARRLRRKKLI